MLASLRRRFILITMGIVGLMLLAMLTASVVFSYQATAGTIRSALDRAVGAGIDNEQRPWIGEPNQDAGSLPGMLFDLLIPHQETSAQSGDRFIPVYVVILDATSLTVLADNSSVVLIESSVAQKAVSAVLEKLPRQGLVPSKSLTGLLFDQQLFYRLGAPGDGSLTIALADASELLRSTFLQAGASALIWLGAMVALFFVSLLLSRLVTRPVAAAWERQRRFVADASHELKTPLAVILANNSLLAAHPERTVAEQHQWVESTQLEAQHMDGLVRDLLLLAQTEEEDGRPPAQKAPWTTVDLSALLRHGLLQFEAVFFERGITLTTDLAEGVTVTGNAEQLERLAQILLDNASKYAGTPGAAMGRRPGDAGCQGNAPMPPPRPTVHVSLHPGAGGATGATTGAGTATGGAKPLTHALLKITNSGEPIAPDALPHLFERFYRADSAHSSSEGSGLGLSLAQSIVESHRGTITVSSDATHGTTFTVSM
ncbi:MAG: HAMP domain-containing histidine kinase [Coriobacteriales bacterium]|jgi:signal transduction histidine kinase|nr:HAMP domain-containing histidine kinase [Coriobacteriales bacterium]